MKVDHTPCLVFLDFGCAVCLVLVFVVLMERDCQGDCGRLVEGNRGKVCLWTIDALQQQLTPVLLVNGSRDVAQIDRGKFVRVMTADVDSF